MFWFFIILEYLFIWSDQTKERRHFTSQFQLQPQSDRRRQQERMYRRIRLCFCKLYANWQQEDAKTLREADVGYVWVEVNIWKKEILPSVDRNAVGGSGTGGLMTSCCSFLFAHRNMPKEQEGKMEAVEKKMEVAQLEESSEHTPERKRVQAHAHFLPFP